MVELSSFLKGQNLRRSSMADTSSADGRVGVLVGTKESYVGNGQLVVKLMELVNVSGAGPHVNVSGGVVIAGGVVVEGTTGVNSPVCPGGPMQMYFPIMNLRFAQSVPIVGFQDHNISVSTADPASFTKEEHVSSATTWCIRHLETSSRQSLSPFVMGLSRFNGNPLYVKSLSVETERLFATELAVSPSFTVYGLAQVCLDWCELFNLWFGMISMLTLVEVDFQ